VSPVFSKIVQKFKIRDKRGGQNSKSPDSPDSPTGEIDPITGRQIVYATAAGSHHWTHPWTRGTHALLARRPLVREVPGEGVRVSGGDGAGTHEREVFLGNLDASPDRLEPRLLRTLGGLSWGGWTITDDQAGLAIERIRRLVWLGPAIGR
jgi:hypothetical protein